MTSKVLSDFLRIGTIVLVIAARNSDTERQVPNLLMKVKHDEVARIQDPFRDGCLGSILGMSSQQHRVDKCAVGGLVLDHDVAPFVDIDAEMDVADSLERVIL